MLNALFTKIFGSRNERLVKKMGRVVDQVNTFEDAIKALSDEELKAKTAEFKARFADGETLEAMLPEAFATVREASIRTLGLRHYDVQLIGGIVLHEGKIAEMKTGEGKTLMSTLACYLNAISGNSVHVVTVNDYLAARDADWMRPIYTALDMQVGVVVPGMTHDAKRAAYACEVV
ncbi:MAG: preprotein translocase subunit SecA, partial [Lysobacterales bacterium]